METLLQYAGEHRSCLNYRMPQDAAIKLLHYPEGMRQIVDTDESLIIFVLEGEVKVSADGHNDVLHRAGYISLQPRNSSSYIQVQQPCTFISFHSPHDITLCDRFSVQSLPRYIPEGFHYQFTLLPIRQRLAEYATGLRHCLEDGLGCVHFLEMKMQELFILLRAYYNREELATFFYPLIGKNRDFQDFVYEHYRQVDSLNEFAALANTSVDTFKRRFKETFGEPANTWLRRQMGQRLVDALSAPGATLKEVTDHLGFSSASALNRFCKRFFHCTPTELQERIAHASGPETPME